MSKAIRQWGRRKAKWGAYVLTAALLVVCLLAVSYATQGASTQGQGFRSAIPPLSLSPIHPSPLSLPSVFPPVQAQSESVPPAVVSPRAVSAPLAPAAAEPADPASANQAAAVPPAHQTTVQIAGQPAVQSTDEVLLGRVAEIAAELSRQMQEEQALQQSQGAMLESSQQEQALQQSPVAMLQEQTQPLPHSPPFSPPLVFPLQSPPFPPPVPPPTVPLPAVPSPPIPPPPPRRPTSLLPPPSQGESGGSGSTAGADEVLIGRVAAIGEQLMLQLAGASEEEGKREPGGEEFGKGKVQERETNPHLPATPTPSHPPPPSPPPSHPPPPSPPPLDPLFTVTSLNRTIRRVDLNKTFLEYHHHFREGELKLQCPGEPCPNLGSCGPEFPNLRACYWPNLVDAEYLFPDQPINCPKVMDMSVEGGREVSDTRCTHKGDDLRLDMFLPQYYELRDELSTFPSLPPLMYPLPSLPLPPVTSSPSSQGRPECATTTVWCPSCTRSASHSTTWPHRARAASQQPSVTPPVPLVVSAVLLFAREGQGPSSRPPGVTHVPSGHRILPCAHRAGEESQPCVPPLCPPLSPPVSLSGQFSFEPGKAKVHHYDRLVSLMYPLGIAFYHVLIELVPHLFVLSPLLRDNPSIPIAIASHQVKAFSSLLVPFLGIPATALNLAVIPNRHADVNLLIHVDVLYQPVYQACGRSAPAMWGELRRRFLLPPAGLPLFRPGLVPRHNHTHALPPTADSPATTTLTSAGSSSSSSSSSETLPVRAGVISESSNEISSEEDVPLWSDAQTARLPYSWRAVIAHRRGAMRHLAAFDSLVSEMKRVFPPQRVFVFEGDLPILQAKLLFNRAAVYVGLHGAGLSNMIFMPSNSSVFEIRPRDYPNPCYHHLTMATQQNYYLVFGNGTKDSELRYNMSEVASVLRVIADQTKRRVSARSWEAEEVGSALDELKESDYMDVILDSDKSRNQDPT
ncbi:unnamed protein product [Closterium sp. NIES-54]